jgi:hypothetical protein
MSQQKMIFEALQHRFGDGREMQMVFLFRIESNGTRQWKQALAFEDKYSYPTKVGWELGFHTRWSFSCCIISPILQDN